jgi:hypothetical protein
LPLWVIVCGLMRIFYLIHFEITIT